MEQEKEIKEFIQEKYETEPVFEKKETIIQEQKEDIVEKNNIPETVKEEPIIKVEEKKELSEKVEELFQIAKNKGLVQAIKIVKKTGDGYLIDLFRDRLVENDYYKKFLK